MTRRTMCPHGWLTGPGPGQCPVDWCPATPPVAPRRLPRTGRRLPLWRRLRRMARR